MKLWVVQQALLGQIPLLQPHVLDQGMETAWGDDARSSTARAGPALSSQELQGSFGCSSQATFF